MNFPPASILAFLWLLRYSYRRPGGAKDYGSRADYSAFIVRHTALVAGNDAITGPDGKEAGAWGQEMTVGRSYNICYFP